MTHSLYVQGFHKTRPIALFHFIEFH